MYFFFFSSRRRHTRCLSDWSSDVCSSDLPNASRQSTPGPTNSRQRLECVRLAGAFARHAVLKPTALLPRMKPLADCQLYTFVDTAFLRGRQPDAIAQQLCQGGSDLIQLRAKTSTIEEI